jgi:transcriptional regulator with XRE-family HTH domain
MTSRHPRVGALIARRRREQGKSQSGLADALCLFSGRATVTRHEISRWERGRRVPGRPWLRFLAWALDVRLEDLERASADDRRS